jgi:DNA polymerase-3 subunit gamma/tau
MFTSQTSNNCKIGITFVHSIMAENFVVSALKYRPQTFDTVVGQSHITTTLKNAIKTNQLAHSFLFCGPRGVGKTTCARILAKTINCLTPTANFEACDTCENCVSFKNNTSFNVHELDAASNNSVDDIRVLTDQVRFAPQGGSKYKVYIIDEVHMLSQQAFNAFLKTLEEPPSYAIFILGTTEKHKILPTILSRCQIFDFKRITTKDTVDHLQHICEIEKVSAETDALHFIALKSEGCMRDSLSIMDKIISFGGGQITYTNTIENLNILDYDYFFKMTEAVATQNLSSAMLMYDDILAKGFEGDMFMNGFAEHFRNLMMCKDERIVRLMDVAEGIKKRYFDQANSISNSLIINAISILNNSELDYKMARNKRLHVEMALIKLCHLIQAIQIVSHADGIAKKKLTTNFISPIFKKAAASLQIDESLIAKTAANASSVVADPLVQPIAVAHKKEETIVKPIVSNTNTSGSNGGIKLANLKSIADKAKEALAEKATQQKIAITAENLKEVWQKTIVHFTEGKEFFATSMKNARVSFDKETISIIAVDMMGAEFMMSNKLPITQFLMAQFVNNHLHVIMDKDIQASQDTTKTTKSIKEKYDDFVKENPLVQKMKDDLGLEMEY